MIINRENQMTQLHFLSSMSLKQSLTAEGVANMLADNYDEPCFAGSDDDFDSEDIT